MFAGSAETPDRRAVGTRHATWSGRTAAALFALASLFVGCLGSEEAVPREREPECRGAFAEELPRVDVPEIPVPAYDTERAARASWPEPPRITEEELAEAVDDAAAMDVDRFLEVHAVPRETTLPYDPLRAANLSLVQSSDLFLDPDERAALGRRGFVISERQRFATFLEGYEAIYLEDLPVFVSVDSILHALHRSFDAILQRAEREVLVRELELLLGSLREAAAAEYEEHGPSPHLAALDEYLTTAHRFATREDPLLIRPRAGGDVARVDAWYEAGLAAGGAQGIELFGTRRLVDFSQLAPRGHYQENAWLAAYFRAMVWLGRVDLRLVEDVDHELWVRRPQVAATLVLDRLLERAGRDRWHRIDRLIGAFTGGRETMLPREIAAALAEIGVRHEDELSTVSDDVLARQLLDVGAARRRVASTLLIRRTLGGTAMQPVGVALFGQRFTIDAQVLGNLVYDRVGGGEILRMMPTPLDVAFAALGNDDAARLLEPELRAHSHAPDLETARVAVDAHEEDFWKADLYHRWVHVLRALSPRENAPEDLPSVARTEAWGRRVLNTQLASWTELRHDTVLYAAQSYASGLGCDYPDAWVEPAPEAFLRMADLAAGFEELAGDLAPSSEELATDVVTWARNTRQTVLLLADMADRQRTGQLPTQAQLDFLEHAVRTSPGCVRIGEAEGWYPDLFFVEESSYEDGAVVVDVHTQPTDELGALVGRVLHVGTGLPRLMAVTFETCQGPRLYLGLVSSYHEMITSDFERLNDQDHRNLVHAAPPPDVPWMRDLVVRWPRCGEREER